MATCDLCPCVHMPTVHRPMKLYAQHSLVNDGVTSSLADHEISPLDNNDRHKERRVTREL